MNLKSLLSVLLFINAFCASYPLKTFIPLAIKEYAKNRFVKNSIKFDFIYNVKDSRLMEDIIQEVSEVDSFKIIQMNPQEGKESIQLERSAILIFNSFEDFQAFDNRSYFRDDGSKYLEFLWYCQSLKSQKITENLPKDKFHFRSYILEENGKILLKTLTLFTPEKCNEQHLITINEFSRNSLRWSTHKFFDPVIRNFHGCKLTFALYENQLPSSDCSSITDQVSGYIPDFLFNARKYLNFTLAFYCLDRRADGTHAIYEEGYKNVDFTLVAVPIDSKASVYLSYGSAVEFSHMILVIPPGEPYTALEKLFLPFDDQTWMWFFILFLASLLVVFIIKYSCSSDVKNFIFGRNVSSPAYNIFIIFMGGGMIILPTTNFARYILMLYILYCLIMRTAYQGKYFEFVTSDTHKKEAQSIKELAEKNFTLYTFTYGDDWVEELEILERFSIKYDVSTYDTSKLVSDDLLNSRFKGCFLISDTFFKAWTQQIKIHHNISPNWIILPEKIVTVWSSFVYTPHHFLRPIIEEKVQESLNGGLFEKIIKESYSNIKPDPPKPEILTMEHLMVGFNIWLIMLGLSFAVFLGEILIYNLKIILATFWNRNLKKPRIRNSMISQETLNRFN